MNIRENTSRSRLMMIVGAIAAILLLVLAVRQLTRFTSGERVWVASAGLVPGALVSETDMRLVSARGAQLPAGVIRDRGQIQGRQLTRRKQEGAAFTAADFQAAQQQRAVPAGLADTIPEGRVLMPLQISPSLFPSSRLRRGDRIDIVATAKGESPELVVRDGFLMGQNRSDTVRAPQADRRGPFGMELASASRPKKAPPLYMYLALHPEDALSLSRAQGAGAALRLIMHSREDVRAGRVADLGADKQQTVEVILGRDRETVPISY